MIFRKVVVALIKRLEYFKKALKDKLDNIKDRMTDRQYKIQVDKIEECNDYEKLRDLNDMDMRIEELKYKTEIKCLMDKYNIGILMNNNLDIDVEIDDMYYGGNEDELNAMLEFAYEQEEDEAPPEKEVLEMHGREIELDLDDEDDGIYIDDGELLHDWNTNSDDENSEEELKYIQDKDNTEDGEIEFIEDEDNLEFIDDDTEYNDESIDSELEFIEETNDANNIDELDIEDELEFIEDEDNTELEFDPYRVADNSEDVGFEFEEDDNEDEYEEFDPDSIRPSTDNDGLGISFIDEQSDDDEDDEYIDFGEYDPDNKNSSLSEKEDNGLGFEFEDDDSEDEYNEFDPDADNIKDNGLCFEFEDDDEESDNEYNEFDPDNANKDKASLKKEDDGLGFEFEDDDEEDDYEGYDPDSIDMTDANKAISMDTKNTIKNMFGNKDEIDEEKRKEEHRKYLVYRDRETQKMLEKLNKARQDAGHQAKAMSKTKEEVIAEKKLRQTKREYEVAKRNLETLQRKRTGKKSTGWISMISKTKNMFISLFE